MLSSIWERIWEVDYSPRNKTIISSPLHKIVFKSEIGFWILSSSSNIRIRLCLYYVLHSKDFLLLITRLRPRLLRRYRMRRTKSFYRIHMNQVVFNHYCRLFTRPYWFLRTKNHGRSWLVLDCCLLWFNTSWKRETHYHFG